MTPTRALVGVAAVAAAGYAVIHSVGGQEPQYIGDFPSIQEQAQAERVPVAAAATVGAAAAAPQPSAARSEREPVPAHAAHRQPAAGAERPVLPVRSGEREPAAGPPGPAEGGERPSLPRRRVQANLAPELVDPPAPQQQDEDEIEHNPGLMAAFQRGVRGAEEDDDIADGADSAG